jgi:phosphate starvation-inducible PhoH-like protein
MLSIIFLLFVTSVFGLINNNKKSFLIMKKVSSINPLSKLYTPKTENQKNYVKYLGSKMDYILSVVGPAGTGKTLLACNKAIDELNKKNIDKLIITRPVVPVEEEIGFLPGNIEKKMDPWTRPIFDIFLDSYSKSELTNMIKENIIEISPLGFMRGRTFKNSFIIADEMQNSTPNQMLMLLTRIGTNSKMVITGDLAQSDRIENNGLKDFINKLKNNKMPENFYLVEMEDKDIQRSKLVNDVLQLYNSKPIIPISKPIISKPLIPKPIILNRIINVDTTENGNKDAALIPKNICKK